MTLDLEGLRFLITGGASGIGHAVATAALEGGAAVTVVDLDPSNAPSRAICHRADIADDASVADAVAHAAEAMGGIDVVINNAGIGAQGTVETNSLDEWRHVFEVNVFGMVRVMRGVVRLVSPVACARSELLISGMPFGVLTSSFGSVADSDEHHNAPQPELLAGASARRVSTSPAPT